MIHRLTKNIKLYILSIILTLSGGVYLYFTYQKVKAKEFESIILLARTIVAAVKTSDIKEFKINLSDIENPRYQELKKTLAQIIKANPNARFAYFFTERKGKIYFIVDSEPTDSKDYSPPGQEYLEAHSEDYKIFKDGKESYTGPVTDRWGTWMNVLIPIKDKTTGRTIAAFGLDYNARSWNRALLYEVGESSILIFLLFIAFFVSYKIRITNILLKEEIISRKRVESTLQIAESQQKSLIENIATGIIVYKPDRTILYSNPKAFEILRLTETDLRGRSISDDTWRIIDESGSIIPNTEYPVLNILRTNRLLRDFIFGFAQPDQEKPVWVICNGYPIHDSNGVITEIVITFNDITQLKDSERILQEKERELLESQKVSGIGSFALDIIEDQWSGSPFLNTILGLDDMDHHALQDLASLIHPSDSQMVVDYYKKEVLEKKGLFDKEFRIITKDKNIERWIHGIGKLALNELEMPVKMIGTIQDITDRKKTETELKKLVHAVEQSPASIIITNINGTIEYENSRICNLSGYSLEELKGKNTSIFQSGVTPRETYTEMWNTILKGATWKGELYNRKKNGSLYWEEITISPITDIDGKITHFIAVKEDISDRIKTINALKEAKLKAESSDKLKTAFLNNISHEVRTPLNGILGFGEILAKNKLSDQEKEEYFEILQDSSNRLLNTITAYMDASLLISDNQGIFNEWIRIKEIMSKIYEKYHTICRTKGLLFSINCPNEIADTYISSDLALLLKIFEHLLDNAVKFTKEGGDFIGVYGKG